MKIHSRALMALTLILATFSVSMLSPADSGSGSIELIEKLASPEFEGRGVGTTGLAKARDLLVSRLQENGFTPGIPVLDREGHEAGRSFIQNLRIFVGNELGPKNGFAGSEAGEFMPLAFSRSGSADSAPVVFVGYGITFRGTEGGFAYDDYQGLDIRGKIVVAVLGDPSVGNKSSVFRNPTYFHYTTPMYKVQNAEQHGAAGIVLVRDAYSQAGEAEPDLRFQSRQGGGATSGIMAGQAKITFVEKLIGKDIRGLQERIAREQKPASFTLTEKADLSVDLKRLMGDVQNVAAVLPGTDPTLSQQYVVIGAHYDHLGYGGDSSMDPNGHGEIHPGADDNASGVQAVMDLALKIKEQGLNRRPILFVFFTAEEVGLLGSAHLVENLPLPQGAKASWMMNLDMVGRLQQNQLSVLAVRSAKEFNQVLQETNERFRFDLVLNDQGFGSSDHAAFLQAKIPSIFFTTGAEPDYHRPSDTAEKINVEGLRKVEDFVFATWQALDSSNSAPTYDPSSEESNTPPRQGRGYGVYFGSVPEFNSGDVSSGVLLSGVRPGSPAEKAGLQKGDILTGIGELEIRNLNDLVFALRFFRPNEEVEVRWIRLGASMTAKTVLRSRDGN